MCGFWRSGVCGSGCVTSIDAECCGQWRWVCSGAGCVNVLRAKVRHDCWQYGSKDSLRSAGVSSLDYQRASS